MKNILMIGLAVIFVNPIALRAGDDLTPVTAPTSSTGLSAPSDHYGLFGWLDKRSVYGQGVFPEPFLVDDSDGETNEGRLDWTHTGGPNNMHSDIIHAELEKGIGMLTLEFEGFYERDSDAG